MIRQSEYRRRQQVIGRAGGVARQAQLRGAVGEAGHCEHQCSLYQRAVQKHGAEKMRQQLLKRAGLPETTRFHDLRHSFATLLIAQGVHLSVIKEIFGHSQISVTADIYGHVLPETQPPALGAGESSEDATDAPAGEQGLEEQEPRPEDDLADDDDVAGATAPG